MEITGTETGKNLQKAFEINAKRSLEYNMYALIAKQLGYEDISSLLTRFANNEKEHAKLFYKQIPDSKHFQVNGTYPFSYGDTYSNLIAAASGEREEWEILYKEAAQIAKDEGFDEISRLFANIVEIEKRHSHRFETLAGLLKEGALFKKEEVTQWVCRKCGHTQIGKEAPCKCPVCDHPQGYFELFVEKF